MESVKPVEESEEMGEVIALLKHHDWPHALDAFEEHCARVLRDSLEHFRKEAKAYNPTMTPGRLLHHLAEALEATRARYGQFATQLKDATEAIAPNTPPDPVRQAAEQV
jgi:hypothetical protein